MENYHKVKCGAVIISCCWTELLWWFNNEQQETNIKLLRLHNLHNLSVLSLHTFSFQDSSSCFSLFHWRFIHVSLSATFPASRVSQSNLNIDEPNVGQLAINPHSKDWTNYSAAVINTQPLHGCCRFCATDLLASSALSGIPSTSSGCSGGAIQTPLCGAQLAGWRQSATVLQKQRLLRGNTYSTSMKTQGSVSRLSYIREHGETTWCGLVPPGPAFHAAESETSGPIHRKDQLCHHTYSVT